jgi:hypothetical protein
MCGVGAQVPLPDLATLARAASRVCVAKIRRHVLVAGYAQPVAPAASSRATRTIIAASAGGIFRHAITRSIARRCGSGKSRRSSNMAAITRGDGGDAEPLVGPLISIVSALLGSTTASLAKALETFIESAVAL